MKMSILARVSFLENCFVAQTCWVKYCGDNIEIHAGTKDEAILNLNKAVALFIEHCARKYVEDVSNSNGKINCPEAYVCLPADTWHCKIDKETCPLQGQIDIFDHHTFLNSCKSSQTMKSGIWSAITHGKYKGFHHMPGRYECVLCRKAETNFNYHYPWELTFLADHCKITEIWKDPRRASQLIINGFPLSALSGALCEVCFRKVAKSFPEIRLEDYETIVYEYQRS
jgi:hypothetical protein